MELNLALVPLEYKCSIRLKHPHTLTESLLQIGWPALLGKLPILPFQPRFFSCMHKMGRVKDYKLVRIIRARNVAEVGHKVWIHTEVRSRWNESGFFSPYIHIFCQWIILISPKCPTSTADIQYFFHQIKTNLKRQSLLSQSPFIPSESISHYRFIIHKDDFSDNMRIITEFLAVAA